MGDVTPVMRHPRDGDRYRHLSTGEVWRIGGQAPTGKVYAISRSRMAVRQLAVDYLRGSNWERLDADVR